MGKEPTPLATLEKLLANEGGPGIFFLFVEDIVEEGAVLIQESSLDIGALGEEGPSVQGPEIVIEP